MLSVLLSFVLCCFAVFEGKEEKSEERIGVGVDVVFRLPFIPKEEAEERATDAGARRAQRQGKIPMATKRKKKKRKRKKKKRKRRK